METSLPVNPRSSGIPYDETPYPSSSFPYSHPDKLCAIGRLFGLNPRKPSEARVLELGCADGANLLPMAQHAPGASFLGIDASAKHATSAQKAIATAGLKNVEIRHQDILDFSASEGKFDYIIAHGVFSWVPDEVRDKILAICRDHLAEHGIAYVSYNALPGWSLRAGLRDMMLFHTRGFDDPVTKVQQARALTKFLSEAVPSDQSGYALMLKEELDRMAKHADGFVRHDLLGEENKPFYFYQFIEKAGRAGLQYLGETSLGQMITGANFAPKVAETLDRLSDNIVAKEQYMDFVRNRPFRTTLLCHQGTTLVREMAPESMKPFYFTSLLAPPDKGTLDLAPGVSQSFRTRIGSLAVSSDDAFLKAAFAILTEHSLKRVSFQELLEGARSKSAGYFSGETQPDPAGQEATLAANLLSLYARAIVDIHSEARRFLTRVPEKPACTPLVRYQALNTQNITNHAHQPYQLDLFTRCVISECDGSKGYDQISDSLARLVKENKLTVNENGQTITDDSRIRVVLAHQLRSALIQLTSLGFFAE